MLKLSLSILVICFTQNASAMWIQMDDCDLVSSSALIVEGEFIGTTSIKPDDDNEITLGVIRVKQTLKGSDNDSVLIKQPSLAKPISSTDTFYKKGQQGVWLLSKSKHHFEGIYSADNPQRFKLLAEISVIESCLKNSH